MAVAIAYGSLLGNFTRKRAALKAKLDAFGVSAIANSAEFVFSRDAADIAVRALGMLHLGAFLASYSTDTNFQISHLVVMFCQYGLNNFCVQRLI